MSENYQASIHILNVDTADVGEYHCKAVNDVGSDTCVCSITLKGLYDDLCVVIFLASCCSYHPLLILPLLTFFTVNCLPFNSTTSLCEEAQ